MDYSGKRKDFVDWVRCCLMGPGSQADLLVGIQPADRYHVGVLFPIIKGEAGIDPASEEDDDDDRNLDQEDGSADAEGVKPTQKKRRYIPPSSVGFSFFIQGDRLELQVQAFAV